jgi:hypothetical protein
LVFGEKIKKKIMKHSFRKRLLAEIAGWLEDYANLFCELSDECKNIPLVF